MDYTRIFPESSERYGTSASILRTTGSRKKQELTTENIGTLDNYHENIKKRKNRISLFLCYTFLSIIILNIAVWFFHETALHIFYNYIVANQRILRI